MPDWPPELDAAIAAPEHHKLLLENASVRVFETVIKPGETVPLHTHQWPAVYSIGCWGEFVRRDAEGNVTMDSRTVPPALPGAALWAEPIGPHTLENVGATEIRLTSVEIKAHAS